MKKMMFLAINWHFLVQKALIYYTVNKSHHNSFTLLVFSHVANFRYVANFRFLTLNVFVMFLKSSYTFGRCKHSMNTRFVYKKLPQIFLIFKIRSWMTYL